MRARAAGLAVGLVFGVVLAWSGMSDPDVIRGALLLEESYLFLMFASAVLVATAGSWALRRRRARALLTGERVGWEPQAPERRHLAGSVLFGAGWAIACACPGPIATQLGQGVVWSGFTVVGVVAGIWLFLRRRPAAIDL